MNTIDFRLIRQLWMFLAVAEEQHFGRAAKRLGMSQPPLSEQIKVLEHSLKIKLFERSRRGTQLSAAGAAIFPAVKQFAHQVETLELIVREVAAGQSGVLKIGAITSAMLDTVPPLLHKLKKDFANLTVFVREIDSVDAIPELNAGELDLAFVRLDKEVGQGLAIQPLAEDRLSIVLPKEHALAQEPEVSLASLEREHLIMSSRQVSPAYFDMLTAEFRKYSFTPRITHEVRSIASQIAYVSCEQGVALVPASTRKLMPDNVVLRPLKETIMVVTAALAWKEDRYHPMVDIAIEFLKTRNGLD